MLAKFWARANKDVVIYALVPRHARHNATRNVNGVGRQTGERPQRLQVQQVRAQFDVPRVGAPEHTALVIAHQRPHTTHVEELSQPLNRRIMCNSVAPEAAMASTGQRVIGKNETHWSIRLDCLYPPLRRAVQRARPQEGLSPLDVLGWPFACVRILSGAFYEPHEMIGTDVHAITLHGALSNRNDAAAAGCAMVRGWPTVRKATRRDIIGSPAHRRTHSHSHHITHSMKCVSKMCGRRPRRIVLIT